MGIEFSNLISDVTDHLMFGYDIIGKSVCISDILFLNI